MVRRRGPACRWPGGRADRGLPGAARADPAAGRVTNLRTLLNTFEVSNDVRPEIYAVAFTIWALALGLAFQGLRKDRREERAEQERARERELTSVA